MLIHPEHAKESTSKNVHEVFDKAEDGVIGFWGFSEWFL